MENRSPKRQAAYTAASKIKVVPIADFTKYDQLLPQVRKSLSLPPAPAMACLTKAQINANISGNTKVFGISEETLVSHAECPDELIQHHNDNIVSVGFVLQLNLR